MKQRIFAVLLVLALLVTVGALAVSAADGNEGLPAECPCCNRTPDACTWQVWDGSSITEAGGHYILESDLSLEAVPDIGIEKGGNPINVTIDLNGHSYTNTGRAFMVKGGSTLKLVNSSSVESVVTGGSGLQGGVITLPSTDTNNTFELYDGVTLQNSRTSANTKHGAVISVSGVGTFTMKGGKIIGGTIATKDQFGGSVYVAAGGTFNMEGGVIIGGTANRGGNVYLNGTSAKRITFNMTGGTIQGGTANTITVDSSKTTGQGGNIFMVYTDAVISGGTITGGVAAAEGGNLLVRYSECTISEDACIINGYSEQYGGNIAATGNANTKIYIQGGTISGGYALSGGGNIRVETASIVLNISGGTIDGDMQIKANLKLSGSPTIDLGSSNGLYLTGGTVDATELAQDAEIYVSANGAYTISVPADKQGCFKPAIRSTLTPSGDTLTTAAMANCNTGWCPHCYQNEDAIEATWTEWAYEKGASITENGHHYLSDDLSIAGSMTVGTGADVVLDLNGSNITTTNVRVFAVYGTLSVMGNGYLDGKSTGGPAVIRVDENGILNLYGGIVRDLVEAENHTGKGGAIRVKADGQLNMFGGRIIGTDVLGGAIYVEKGNVSISGGSITGGDVYMERADDAVILSGAPTIEDLNLNNGAKITLSGSLSSANIGITAEENTAFLESAPEDVENNFYSNVEGKNIVRTESNTLVLQAPPIMRDCPHCPGSDLVSWTEWDGSDLHGKTYTGHYHYILTQDVNAETRSESGRVRIGNINNPNAEFCINLSGYNIDINGYKAISINGGTVNLMNANTEKESQLVGSSTAKTSGGILEIKGATVNLYDNIVLSQTTNNEEGMYGLVYVYKNGDTPATFNMRGGTLGATGEVTDGSAVYVAAGCTFNMESGIITGTAQTSGSAVDVIDGGIVSISGGSITDGDVLMEGTTGSIALSGAPEIEHLNLRSGETITPDLEHPLTNTTPIGISAIANQYFVEGSDLEGKFSSMMNAAEISADATGVKLVPVEEYTTETCPGCNAENVTWTIWENGLEITESGHYIMVNNASGRMEFGNNREGASAVAVCFDLNGFRMTNTSESAPAISLHDKKLEGKVTDTDEGHTLNLMNLSDAQSLVQGNRTSSAGRTIGISGVSTLNLLGDIRLTAQETDTEYASNGGVIYVGKGNLNLLDHETYGGVTIDSMPAVNGDAIYVNGGHITMAGGTINGGTAADRGAVYAKGGATVTVNGGTINATKGYAIYAEGATSKVTVPTDDIDAYSGKIMLVNSADLNVMDQGDGLVDATGTVWYKTIDEIKDAYAEGKYIKLYRDTTSWDLSDETETVYAVDINGKENISISGKVNCFDSSNDDFDGYGVVTLDEGITPAAYLEAPNGNLYITVAEGTNQYSFHRLGMGITGVTIRPAVGGAYFTAMWSADTALKTDMQEAMLDSNGNYVITAYGIAVTKGDDTDFINSGAYTYFDCVEGLSNNYLCNKLNQDINSALVKNIIRQQNGAALNVENSNAVLNLCPYIMVRTESGEDEPVFGEMVSKTYKEIIQSAVEYSEKQNDTFKCRMTRFYDRWCLNEKLGLKYEMNNDGTTFNEAVEFFPGFAALADAHKKISCSYDHAQAEATE